MAKVLRFANDRRIAVTPRGAGTGLSGGALPVKGGLVLSAERLTEIRSIDTSNHTAEVEAGVITGDLQRVVERAGLFYPPDPASRDSCLIGGNIAEDSAGPRSCRYGSTRHWVLGLEAVLADGTVVRTGGRSRKNVAGYNLTQLLIGSEGTLAFITEATLKLTPLQPARRMLQAIYRDMGGAARAVSRIMAQPVVPYAVELKGSYNQPVTHHQSEPPRKSVTRPPAARTIAVPAATSQGERCSSQKPSSRPAAT